MLSKYLAIVFVGALVLNILMNIFSYIKPLKSPLPDYSVSETSNYLSARNYPSYTLLVKPLKKVISTKDEIEDLCDTIAMNYKITELKDGSRIVVWVKYIDSISGKNYEWSF